MKIGKKLLLSNIIITLLAMVSLGLFITNIVGNYIEEDIKESIIFKNSILVEQLSYMSFLNNDISYGTHVYIPTEEKSPAMGRYVPSNDEFIKTTNLPVVNLIFTMEENPRLIDLSSNKFGSTLAGAEIDGIFNKKLEEIYAINLDGSPYLAYNSKTEIINNNGEDIEILVVSLLSNEEANSIRMEIIKILVVAILITTVLLIVVTNYTSKMITKPIGKILKTTERIGEKRFDEKLSIKTGDEFEVLANSINDMSGKLKEQDVEQKRFYENISHEIKTPLTVISGYAQGIKGGIIEDKDEALEIITQECNSLKKQLEDVIYLSKLDTIDEPFTIKKIGINQVMGEALDKLYSVIVINDVDIIFEPTKEFYIQGDEEKLLRAFTNILTNCIKYTDDSINITISKDSKWIQINIWDNGKGFSDRILKNPFSRSIVGEKEGTGIGLSIIQKVIIGHNGELTLANKEHAGALYIIKLPIIK